MRLESRRRPARVCVAICLVVLLGGSAVIADPAPQRAPSEDRAKALPFAGPAAGGPSQPAELLLDTIVTWLAANFHLPARYEHPRIEFASPKKLSALRFGEQSLNSANRVVAVYVDSQRTIYLPENWSSRTPAEQSVLVHEMVHHLQNLDSRIYNCAAEREKLAYDAQEKWLSLFGSGLEREFQIDPLTRLVATRCM